MRKGTICISHYGPGGPGAGGGGPGPGGGGPAAGGGGLPRLIPYCGVKVRQWMCWGVVFSPGNSSGLVDPSVPYLIPSLSLEDKVGWRPLIGHDISQ